MPRGAVETKLGGASIAFLDNAPGHRPVDALLEVGTRVLPCNAAPSGGSDGPGKGFLDAKSVLKGEGGLDPQGKCVWRTLWEKPKHPVVPLERQVP